MSSAHNNNENEQITPTTPEQTPRSLKARVKPYALNIYLKELYDNDFLQVHFNINKEEVCETPDIFFTETHS